MKVPVWLHRRRFFALYIQSYRDARGCSTVAHRIITDR